MRFSGGLLAAITVCLPLAGCAELQLTQTQKISDSVSLKESSFEQLPGWEVDSVTQAVIPLQRSCGRILKKDPDADFGTGDFAGTAAAWQSICEDLFEAVPMTDAQARVFFQEHFTPYELHGSKGQEGLFTGYYEPTLHGSRRKHGRYRIPIYGRPNDLIAVNLGDFKPDLKGETIMGRVQKQNLVPYYTRAEIEKGALKKKRQEIVWVDNAVDAFFLHIQGSGQVKLENGKVLRVGYAAQNGHPYTAIGKTLLDAGALEKGNVSMQSIREWLAQHPDEAADVMNINASYIFFHKLTDDRGPLGAEGVPLTPRRSLAVDRKKIPYGVPIWLDAEDPDGEAPLQRLMVAQDTGGAITGAVRGDFFWGAGDEAAHKAGLMKSKGHAWVLLPKKAETETAPRPVQQSFEQWWRQTIEITKEVLK